MSKISEFIKTEDFKKEKHVPVIEIPTAIRAGEEIDVKVSVGKEIKHPNVTEHFIGYIELFYAPSGSKAIINLGRAEFVSHGESPDGPNKGLAHTEPVAVFRVKIDKPGTLLATSYCNIHGLWENSLEVKF